MSLINQLYNYIKPSTECDHCKILQNKINKLKKKLINNKKKSIKNKHSLLECHAQVDKLMTNMKSDIIL